jgi:hypothetical protein
MVGDKVYETQKVAMVNSDINLLSVGDNGKDLHARELLRLHEQHMEVNLAILKAQAHIHHIANKLAAHYPNGHQDVLKHMVKGPAHEYLQTCKTNA